jgi:hypothetical protein
MAPIGHIEKILTRAVFIIRNSSWQKIFLKKKHRWIKWQRPSTLLKLLLHEAEKSGPTGQQLDRIDRHMAALRQLIYRQLELVETDKPKGHNAERGLKLLSTLNDLMAKYQTLRRRIAALAE